MNGDQKLQIANALIEIKVALGDYNKIVEGEDNYDQLRKAFYAVTDITEIIKDA